MPYSSTAYYHPTPPPTLSPAATALLLVLLLALSALYTLGWTPWAPVQSLTGIREMTAFKLSSLAESVGLEGLGKVDWKAVEQQDVHKDKGKQAAGTTQPNATSSGESFSLLSAELRADRRVSLPPPPLRCLALRSLLCIIGLELYPGLLNVSGNLCYLNATLQVRFSSLALPLCTSAELTPLFSYSPWPPFHLSFPTSTNFPPSPPSKPQHP